MTNLKTVRHTTQYPYDALATDRKLDTINYAEAHTLDEMFRERVRRTPNSAAYRQFDRKLKTWSDKTWSEVAFDVERWQVALRASGLEKGDRVAICYQNSIEWVIFDQAALRLGLVIVPIYVSDRVDNIAYILGNSGSKLVLFSNAKTWNEVIATDENIDCVKTVLAFSDDRATKENNVHIVEQWLPEEGQHFERGLAEPDDLASIVYTSGTTGRPKGVMLSHRNMLSNAYNGMRSVSIKPSDIMLSFLPLSHTLERTIGYYSAMMSGCLVAYNRSIPQLADDFVVLKPTVMISVPRIFERIHNTFSVSLESMSPLKRFLFKTAIGVGWHSFRYQQGIASWHPKLLLNALLDHLVAQEVRDTLGGQLRYMIVGGAPLSEEVAKTFIAFGIPLLQGYGLTESSPVVSVNTLKQNRPDSIGLPLRGVEAKLMENDELWVKGDNVMQGYWKNVDATNKTLADDSDGRWLRTGDCASIDQYGFIRIVGRIKDILVLANGEKVPPSDIEAAIAQNSLFEQVMVLGEGKSFLAALVVLNKKIFHTVCEKNGWLPRDVSSAKLHEYLIQQIAVQMEDFPGYATIRKVAICESEWTIEDDLLTSTLKIKRPKIMARFEEQITALYAGHGIQKL